MRGVLSGVLIVPVFLALFCVPAVAPAGEESPPPPFDFRIIDRIEQACRIGVDKAKNEDEALVSLRWRNSALASLVEITYQATLAWLSEERPVEAAALEEGQGRWLTELGGMPGATREELNRTAAFLHARLRALLQQ